MCVSWRPLDGRGNSQLFHPSQRASSALCTALALAPSFFVHSTIVAVPPLQSLDAALSSSATSALHQPSQTLATPLQPLLPSKHISSHYPVHTITTTMSRSDATLLRAKNFQERHRRGQKISERWQLCVFWFSEAPKRQVLVHQGEEKLAKRAAPARVVITIERLRASRKILGHFRYSHIAEYESVRVRPNNPPTRHVAMQKTIKIKGVCRVRQTLM